MRGCKDRKRNKKRMLKMESTSSPGRKVPCGREKKKQKEGNKKGQKRRTKNGDGKREEKNKKK